MPWLRMAKLRYLDRSGREIVDWLRHTSRSHFPYRPCCTSLHHRVQGLRLPGACFRRSIHWHIQSRHTRNQPLGMQCDISRLSYHLVPPLHSEANVHRLHQHSNLHRTIRTWELELELKLELELELELKSKLKSESKLELQNSVKTSQLQSLKIPSRS